MQLSTERLQLKNSVKDVEARFSSSIESAANPDAHVHIDIKAEEVEEFIRILQQSNKTVEKLMLTIKGSPEQLSIANKLFAEKFLAHDSKLQALDLGYEYCLPKTSESFLKDFELSQNLIFTALTTNKTLRFFSIHCLMLQPNSWDIKLQIIQSRCSLYHLKVFPQKIVKQSFYDEGVFPTSAPQDAIVADQIDKWHSLINLNLSARQKCISDAKCIIGPNKTKLAGQISRLLGIGSTLDLVETRNKLIILIKASDLLELHATLKIPNTAPDFTLLRGALEHLDIKCDSKLDRLQKKLGSFNTVEQMELESFVHSVQSQLLSQALEIYQDNLDYADANWNLGNILAATSVQESEEKFLSDSVTAACYYLKAGQEADSDLRIICSKLLFFKTLLKEEPEGALLHSWKELKQKVYNILTTAKVGTYEHQVACYIGLLSELSEIDDYSPRTYACLVNATQFLSSLKDLPGVKECRLEIKKIIEGKLPRLEKIFEDKFLNWLNAEDPVKQKKEMEPEYRRFLNMLICCRQAQFAQENPLKQMEHLGDALYQVNKICYLDNIPYLTLSEVVYSSLFMLKRISEKSGKITFSPNYLWLQIIIDNFQNHFAARDKENTFDYFKRIRRSLQKIIPAVMPKHSVPNLEHSVLPESNSLNSTLLAPTFFLSSSQAVIPASPLLTSEVATVSKESSTNLTQK